MGLGGAGRRVGAQGAMARHGVNLLRTLYAGLSGQCGAVRVRHCNGESNVYLNAPPMFSQNRVFKEPASRQRSGVKVAMIRALACRLTNLS